MMDGIKEESVGFLFNLEVQVAPPAGGSRRGRADVGRRPRRRPRRPRPRGRRRDRSPRRSPTRTRRPWRQGGARSASGVRVSGVDLDTDGQRSGGLRYTAPGEDGRAVETGDQQTVERKADRRGKKVKRKRR